VHPVGQGDLGQVVVDHRIQSLLPAFELHERDGGQDQEQAEHGAESEPQRQTGFDEPCAKRNRHSGIIARGLCEFVVRRTSA